MADLVYEIVCPQCTAVESYGLPQLRKRVCRKCGEILPANLCEDGEKVIEVLFRLNYGRSLFRWRHCWDDPKR
jgi:hypothetical protein